MGYFPFFVDLSGRKCLIVGGGTIALRKAQSVLEYGAVVKVVAPCICDGFDKLKEALWQIRKQQLKALKDAGESVPS